jgi:hypothetical protein
MSYNGTVRCSYCGEKGHTRATCRHLEERMRELLEKGTVSQRGHAERYFDKKLSKSRRAQSRRCTYCNETGHNRRTCNKLERHINVYADMVYEARQKMLSNMIQFGFGPGALVSFQVREWVASHNGWFNKDGIGIVTAMDLDRATHNSLCTNDHGDDKKPKFWVEGVVDGEKKGTWLRLPAKVVVSPDLEDEDYTIQLRSPMLNNRPAILSPAPAVKEPHGFATWADSKNYVKRLSKEDKWSTHILPWDLREELESRGEGCY